MPKTSRTGSKRQSLRLKYTIHKKAKDFKRKQKREEKKNPHLRKKLRKDPGIPNLWPFKEQMLAEIEANKLKKQNGQQDDDMQTLSEMEILRNKALASETEYEQMITAKENSDTGAFVDPGRRSFFREFKKVIKSADVILEVLDARDPVGTRSISIEREILTQDPNKKIVLVLNKIDLIPKENLQKWLKYLRNDLPTIAFKCSTQHKQKGGYVQKSGNFSDAEGESLGAANLISLLKNYCRAVDVKTAITVGIIGIPNVGKSSLINSLKREKAVGVGATPGFTRTTQEVHLDKNIKLLDCPGIIFSNSKSEAEAALRNAIKIEQLKDSYAVISLMIEKCKDKLLEVYKLTKFKDTEHFLQQVAESRKRYLPGGILDLEGAAKLVLQEWSAGKIPYMTEPPSTKSTHIDAAVVQGWGDAFNINAIAQDEQVNVLNALPETDFNRKFFTVATTEMEEDAPEEDMDSEDYYSDSEDEMDADDKPTKPQPKPSGPHKKQNLQNDDVNNPRTNKAVKAAKKKDRKEAKRATKDQENYDFNQDFWSNVPQDQIVNNNANGDDMEGYDM